MRLWWVSMSLFMEWEGELGVVIFSCCSSNGIPHWLMRLERSEELVVVSSSFTSSTSSNSWKRDMVDSLVRSISTSIQLLSMEAVFSMSKWSEEKVSRKPPVPGIAYPWLVVLLLLLLFICSLAKAVSDVNDAMMLYRNSNREVAGKPLKSS